MYMRNTGRNLVWVFDARNSVWMQSDIWKVYILSFQASISLDIFVSYFYQLYTYCSH